MLSVLLTGLLAATLGFAGFVLIANSETRSGDYGCAMARYFMMRIPGALLVLASLIVAVIGDGSAERLRIVRMDQQRSFLEDTVAQKRANYRSTPMVWEHPALDLRNATNVDDVRKAVYWAQLSLKLCVLAFALLVSVSFFRPLLDPRSSLAALAIPVTACFLTFDRIGDQADRVADLLVQTPSSWEWSLGIGVAAVLLLLGLCVTAIMIYALGKLFVGRPLQAPTEPRGLRVLSDDNDLDPVSTRRP